MLGWLTMFFRDDRYYGETSTVSVLVLAGPVQTRECVVFPPQLLDTKKCGVSESRPHHRAAMSRCASTRAGVSTLPVR